ncbi:hypothetical protein [Spirosoma pomorum]
MTRFLLLLTFLLAGSCHRSVDPGDPLYRTWRWSQLRLGDGRLIDLTRDDRSIITFRPNGTILYGANGRYQACCAPNRFHRQTDTLNFLQVGNIPVPPVDYNEFCSRVDCLPFEASWTIKVLNTDTLVLQTGQGERICIPYL